jgi:TRAP-type mannitol/chloroaromatic compound transport system permease large subunit
MRKPLFTALIWMLMLALPAQSMASIGMQLCAVSQQSSAMGQVDSQMTAHHPGALVMAQAAEASAHDQHHVSDNSDNSTRDNSMCSLCAFCVGATTLSTVFVSNSPQQAVEPSLARLEQFVGFIAETPERPPRLFLA